jgi:hypothetical protein
MTPSWELECYHPRDFIKPSKLALGNCPSISSAVQELLYFSEVPSGSSSLSESKISSLPRRVLLTFQSM